MAKYSEKSVLSVTSNQGDQNSYYTAKALFNAFILAFICKLGYYAYNLFFNKLWA